MTKVKICGLMREADINAASGADYLGFIVDSASRHALSLMTAKDLMSITSGKKVMVTTEVEPNKVLQMARYLEPDVIQMHSIRSFNDLSIISRNFPGEVWSLVLVGLGNELWHLRNIIHCSDAVVLDTYGPLPGGNGRTHNWAVSRHLRDVVFPFPIILAGGLNINNVEDALKLVRPYCVDTSSGVERNGQKDPDLVKKFIEKARSVD